MPKVTYNSWDIWTNEKPIPSEFGTWTEVWWTGPQPGYQLVAGDGQILAFTREIPHVNPTDRLMTISHGAWLSDGASVVDLGSYDTVREARQAVEERLNA